MMDSSKHTPTPWEFIRDDNIILGNGGRVMSWQTRSIDSSVAERDANAAFIVRAVNAHDPLAQAARAAIEVFERQGWLETSPDPEAHALRLLRAALAAAEA